MPNFIKIGLMATEEMLFENVDRRTDGQTDDGYLSIFTWLLEDYSRKITSKLLSKYLKSDRNKGLLSLFPL